MQEISKRFIGIVWKYHDTYIYIISGKKLLQINAKLRSLVCTVYHRFLKCSLRMCACHNTHWQADQIYLLLLGQSKKLTSRSQSVTPVSSQVSGNQSERARDMRATTLGEVEALTNTTPNQLSTNEVQTYQSQVDQSVTNVTANPLPTNQTTTRLSQINQPSENTTADQLPTNQGNLLQTSQSATKGTVSSNTVVLHNRGQYIIIND